MRLFSQIIKKKKLISAQDEHYDSRACTTLQTIVNWKIGVVSCHGLSSAASQCTAWILIRSTNDFALRYSNRHPRSTENHAAPSGIQIHSETSTAFRSSPQKPHAEGNPNTVCVMLESCQQAQTTIDVLLAVFTSENCSIYTCNGRKASKKLKVFSLGLGRTSERF